jgi:hypothetical protein
MITKAGLQVLMDMGQVPKEQCQRFSGRTRIVYVHVACGEKAPMWVGYVNWID